ncbi:glycosyltransferase, partial [Bacteroides caecigallinarum]|uniref:glycosyltransferase n=1 Tax=Bacteroides caecigallinarum TaxID=1411144 RepID=UPI00195ECD6B
AYGYGIKSLYTNILFVYKYLKNNNYDIIHITGTEHYLLPFLPKEKTIVTVHDVGSIITANKSKIHSWIKKLLWIKTLSLARFVTFISTQTMNETNSMVMIKHSKVIFNPVDPSFLFSPKSLNIEKPIILHIGTKKNKNLDNTVIALKDINCHLRIVGKLSAKQIDLLNNSGISYSNVFNISDKELLEEYKQCDIVNFISTYEGFGMPIIEGQAIGRVVVTSNLEPMKSVADNGAIFVNPYDLDSIREGYKKAITEYLEIVAKGIENVKRFNVNCIASQYLDLYNEII